MDKAVLVIDMPNCCDECFALEEYGDYPVCLITKEQKGYKFRTKENKMDKCPLRNLPDKFENTSSSVYGNEFADGWNCCITTILRG